MEVSRQTDRFRNKSDSACGKRLSKQIKSKNKEKKVIRFFYLADTEIGSLDEQGNFIDLKIPSNPNNPEEPSFAIEIKNKIYVPTTPLLTLRRK